jgi:hypothetical protein
MFIPLVDLLRCTQPHEETWLVASIEQAEERFIIEGMLGCPTCLAEYPIRAAIVYFSERAPSAASTPPDEHEAMRVAAALDLTDQRMTVLLLGRWGAHAAYITAFSPAQLLLLNPPEGIASGDGLSVLVSDVAPLAAASVNAIAVDGTESNEMLASLRRSLRAGGRLLAPITVSLPPGFVELVRDDDVWVARLDDAAVVSAPISIQRRK